MNIITTIDKIEAIVSDIRDDKSTVVGFTNGCFDILHRGHVEYLEQARAMCDCLVIGLNSDASVRRLKGSDRPYTAEDDRAYVLSRLEAVDVVCLFEEDTPLELIKKVRPDILIKGGDYNLDQIVGRDFVEENGGRVLTIPFVSGKSTTGLVQKIKGL